MLHLYAGFLFITGRCDDVLNVSGHRIGTAEVESALVGHPLVAQAAVVGRPHPIKGQAICAYCTLIEGASESDELFKQLKNEVRNGVGPFAQPDLVIISGTSIFMQDFFQPFENLYSLYCNTLYCKRLPSNDKIRQDNEKNFEENCSRRG